MEVRINWQERNSVVTYAKAMAKMLGEALVIYKRKDRDYYQVCRACVWPDRLMDINEKGYGVEYAHGIAPPEEKETEQ